VNLSASGAIQVPALTFLNFNIISIPPIVRMRDLFRCANDCLIVKCIVDDVDTHRLASLIVKVVKQWSKVFKLQYCQHVIVAVNWKLHQTHQLLRHRTACLQTTQSVSK